MYLNVLLFKSVGETSASRMFFHSSKAHVTHHCSRFNRHQHLLRKLLSDRQIPIVQNSKIRTKIRLQTFVQLLKVSSSYIRSIFDEYSQKFPVFTKSTDCEHHVTVILKPVNFAHVDSSLKRADSASVGGYGRS